MADKEWYYSDGEDQHGPVSNAELKKLATSGELKPDNLIWCDGMDDWQPVSEMKGLIAEKKKPKPARKAPRPARRKGEPKPTAANEEPQASPDPEPDKKESEKKEEAKDHSPEPEVEEVSAEPAEKSETEGDQWYYSDGEDQHGPVSHDALKKLASEGKIEPDNLVWCDGMDDWVPAGEMKDLVVKKKKPKPARRKDRPKPSSSDQEPEASTDSAKKEEAAIDISEPEVVDVEEVEEIEEVVDDEPAEEEDLEEEEVLDESLGLEDAAVEAGDSYASSQTPVVNVTSPSRSMMHSLALLIVWAGCGVFVAVGGATFVNKWRSLEESAAVTAEAGAFLVQFVGAYVFARAAERVMQLLADMSRR